MESKEPRGFNKAKKKTEALINDEAKLKKLLSSAKEKAQRKKQKLKDVWEEFQTLFRLVNAWRAKGYRQVPWKTIIYSVAAILYFLSPIDAIPDFIPISGFLDDITVISFVVSSLREDIAKFRDWEKQLDDAT